MNKATQQKLIAASLATLAFILLLVATSAMKGTGGSTGTPQGILFLGVVHGLLTSLVAAGIILIYRTTRIINFAQAAIGAAGGVFAYNLAVADTTNFPFLLAFPIGVIISALIGIGLELGFVRRFFNAPRLVLTVVTIALIPALGFASGFIQTLPIFGDPQDRSPLELAGSLQVPMPFSNLDFQIGTLSLPFGFAHLFGLLMSLLALGGLAAFFRYTKAGVAVRAASENSDRAMLLGINVKGLSTIVWGITGVLSGVGVVLSGAVSQSFGSLTAPNPGGFLIALTAAVIARMRSLPIAVATAVWLEVARQAVRWSYESQLSLFDVFLFALILIGLFSQRAEARRSDDQEISSWKATEEIRPTPKEMTTIVGVRIWRIVLIAGSIAAVLIFPWASSPGTTNQAGYFAIVGIAMLSLVVLTGWAGQVSLGQFALVGLGAILGGAITAKLGWSFWAALPLGTVATGLLAVVIGLPALRIRGLYLAVATYSFAFAVESNMFSPQYFGWILPDRVDRPKLLFFDFEDERSMYYLALFSFVLAIAAVVSLRKSRPGRVLIASRENEVNVQAFGINLVRSRLAAFAFAGGLCGFAGVLLAHHQRAVAANTFPASESLQLFIFTVIGGIGSVAGAILGSIYFALNRLLATAPLLALVIGPVGLLVLLYIAPGGLSSLIFGMRDGVLRIIAQRKRMVVPSLFADIDPEVVSRQVAPLAEPLPNTGLVAIPYNRRYKSESRLHGLRGKLAGNGASEVARREMAAFDAAVGAIEARAESERQAPAKTEEA